MSAFIAVIVALAAGGLNPAASPFAPAPAPAPRIVRLLAPSGAFDATTLGDFERESGYAVAYDAYGDARQVLPMMEGPPYDVVVLPGPSLARAIAAGQLRKIDKTRVGAASLIAAPVAAKLAAYDPGGAYGLAWGWSATGLIYDAGKAPGLLGGVAQFLGRGACSRSRGQARAVRRRAARRPRRVVHRRLAAPRRRSGEGARARGQGGGRSHYSRSQIRPPAGLARPDRGDGGRRGLPDLRRRGAGGNRLAPQPRRRRRPRHSLRSARQGAPIAIDALAEPRNAPHPDEALALIDFLLRPAVAAKATEAAGLASAQTGATAENFRALWPVGAYDAKLMPVIEKEWARVNAPEPPQSKPPGKPTSKPAAKPTAPWRNRRNG